MSHTTDPIVASPPWLEFLEGSLAQVEARLSREIESPVKAISTICARSISAGGKRFRPALVILGALATDPDADVSRAVQLGAGIELLHLGTLMHDDVVDGAEYRRGSPSANSLYGNKLPVLVGDFLLARAFTILSDEPEQRIIDRMAEVVVALSEGEVLELVMSGTLGELESLYWNVINRKTARLISASLEMGAISSGGRDAVVEALAASGERIGLAFQLTDDLLDLVGAPDEVGKPVGADLADGKVTLPYILGLKSMDPENRERLLRKTFEGRLEPHDLALITSASLEAGVPEQCRKLAREQVQLAARHLAVLEPTPAKSILEEIGPYLLSRTA